MIDAKELRIGNICLRKNKHTEIEQIHELTASCILDISSNGVNSSFIYQPIQLTEELLLKCGFEKNFEWTCSIYIKGNYKLVYYVGEKGWSIGFKNYSDYSNLNYLHQLQNLYWCLVGGELNISL
jgi:hypothetical protein